MLASFLGVAWGEPVLVQVAEPVVDLRVIQVSFVRADGRTVSEQVRLSGGHGVVDLPPDAGPLLVATAGGRAGAAWKPTSAGGELVFVLGTPGCVYLDVDREPIPGVAVGASEVTVHASMDGAAPCTSGRVVLPGGVAVAVPPGQGSEVVLPVRRVDLADVGLLTTPTGTVADDGFTALGRWLPIGVASEDRVTSDGLVRRTLDVPATGGLAFGPDAPAPGFVLSPADPSIAAWGVRAGDFQVVTVSARDAVVYPATWPVTLQVWGSGGLWGEVVVAEGQTRAQVELGPDARLRELPTGVAELRKRILPEYPRGLGVGVGPVTCRARVYVDEQGRPYDVGFPDCPEPFRASARDALTSWRWYPVTEGDGGLRVEVGVASEVRDPVRVTFEIVMTYAGH